MKHKLYILVLAGMVAVNLLNESPTFAQGSLLPGVIRLTQTGLAQCVRFQNPLGQSFFKQFSSLSSLMTSPLSSSALPGGVNTGRGIFRTLTTSAVPGLSETIYRPDKFKSSPRLDSWLSEKRDFDWDVKNSFKNSKKHGIEISSAEELFNNKSDFIPLGLQIKPEIFEQRYGALGKDSSGKLLSVCFTIRRNKIRVISVRPVSPSEKKMYETQKRTI